MSGYTIHKGTRILEKCACYQSKRSIAVYFPSECKTLDWNCARYEYPTQLVNTEFYTELRLNIGDDCLCMYANEQCVLRLEKMILVTTSTLSFCFVQPKWYDILANKHPRLGNVQLTEYKAPNREHSLSDVSWLARVYSGSRHSSLHDIHRIWYQNQPAHCCSTLRNCWYIKKLSGHGHMYYRKGAI